MLDLAQSQAKARSSSLYLAPCVPGTIAEHVRVKQRPWENKLGTSLAKPNSGVGGIVPFEETTVCIGSWTRQVVITAMQWDVAIFERNQCGKDQSHSSQNLGFQLWTNLIGSQFTQCLKVEVSLFGVNEHWTRGRFQAEKIQRKGNQIS